MACLTIPYRGYDSDTLRRMSASFDNLCDTLAPARRAKLQLHVPLFVDTFPLGYLFAFGRGASTASHDSVAIHEWNDREAIRPALRKAMELEVPFGAYLSADQATELTRGIRSTVALDCALTVLEVPVSTLRIRKFFARPTDRSRPATLMATLNDWLVGCRDANAIVVHSDIANLSAVGRRHLTASLAGVSSDWNRVPAVLDANQGLPNLLLASQQASSSEHIYWFSELGLIAMHKTARDYPQFSVPQQVASSGEYRLKFVLVVPQVWSLARQRELRGAIVDFHTQLFALSHEQLCDVFDPLWRAFMSAFVRKWPIFNLFEDVGEYARCFTEHHITAVDG